MTGTDFSNLHFDVFMIGQLMKLLDSQPSLRDAIQKGLARLGQRLNVSRAYIIEDCGDGVHSSNTFEWCNEGVEPEMDRLQNIEYPMGDHGRYLNEFDADGLLVSADVRTLPEDYRAILEPQGIRALAQCAIMDAGAFCGFVGVDECAGTRSWPGWQIDTLRVAAAIFGSYLFEGRGKKQLALPEIAIQTMEKTPAFTYIVDPDTREVLYANAALNAVFGRDTAGEICYRSFMGKDAVCESCPIKTQYAAGAAIPVVVRRKGVSALMQASPVLWRGRRAMIVSGADGACFASDAAAARQNFIRDEARQYTRTLAPLFDEIFEVDFDNDRFEALYTKETRKTGKHAQMTVTAAIERWSGRFARDAERAAYRAFMTPAHLRGVFQSGQRTFIDYSVRLPDGSVSRVRSTLLHLGGGRYLCCNKDITQLEKAGRLREEALKIASAADAESRYQIVVERTNTAVVEMNCQTGQVAASPAYSRYEVSRHSQASMFANAGSRAFVHPDDRQTLERFCAETRGNATRAEAVLRVMMTDGSYRWTRMTGSFLYDENGARTRSIATFTDVDEETRARLALGDVSERLSRILRSIPAGVVIYEMGEGRFPVYASDRACEIFGFTREEYDLRIANHQPLSFSPREGDLPANSRSVLLSGKPLSIPRLLAKKKDGTPFWIRVFCSVSREKDGAPLCYAVVSDITGEVETERALLWQAEKFRILSESAGMITFDYSPLEDVMRISIPVSGKGLAEEVVKDYIKNFARNGRVPDREKGGFINALLRASSRALSGVYDFRGNYFGAERWYRAKFASLADSGGQVFRVVGRLDDITDIKE